MDGDPGHLRPFLPQLVTGSSNSRHLPDIVVPVTTQTSGEHLTEMRLSPFDTLLPAPQNNGLNSNYDYVGAISDYTQRNEVSCHWEAARLVCSQHAE